MEAPQAGSCCSRTNRASSNTFLPRLRPGVDRQILRRPVFRGRYSPSAFGIAGVGGQLWHRPGHADDKC